MLKQIVNPNSENIVKHILVPEHSLVELSFGAEHLVLLVSLTSEVFTGTAGLREGGHRKLGNHQRWRENALAA